MQTRGITEKLLLFKHRNKLTFTALADEIGISRVYLWKLIEGQYDYSTKIEEQIKQMFLRYEFYEGMDERGVI